MPEYDLGTARGKIVIDSSGVQQGLNEAQRAQGQFAKGMADGNKQITMTAEQAGTTLQQTGAKIGLLGVGMLGVVGVAVKTAADFEKTISAIGAVSGATEKELGKLSDKALDLGAKTKFSAAESAMAMEELVKAGLSVEDVLNGAADATVALAAAGEIALPEAAAIASAAMNQFKLSAEELPNIADKIAGAANASSIDVNDFSMSMNQAGVVASTVGLSFDDLALAITAMGKQGLKGSDAGTSLKTMLLNLNPTTDKQINLFKELGIVQDANVTSANELGNAFFDANGKIKSMSEIAGVMETALAGMSEQQRLAALETMFGTDALRAASLIAGTGAKEMDNLASQIGKISAADVAAERMDNLAGSIEEFKGSVETMLIKAGQPFQDVLKQVVDIGTSLVNFFGNLPGPIQKAVTWFLVIAGAALTFAGAGSIILGTFLKFGVAMREFRAALQVVRSIDLVSRAMGALNAVMALNPIVLIIGGIILLGAALYGLYRHSEGFRNFVDGLWQGIQRVWDAILGFVREIPEKIGEAIGWIRDKVSDILDWLGRNWDLLLPIFLGPLGLIIVVIRRWGDDIIKFFRELPGKLLDWIRRGFDAVVDFFRGLPGRLLGAVRGLWDGFLNLIREFPGNVLGLIGDGIERVIGLFTGIPGRIAGAIGGVGRGIGGFFSNLFGGGDEEKEADATARRIAEGGEKVANAGVDFINNIKDRLDKEGDYRNGGWYLGDVRVGESANGHEDGEIILNNVAGLKENLSRYGEYSNGQWKIGDIVVGTAPTEDSDLIIEDLTKIQAAAEGATAAAQDTGKALADSLTGGTAEAEKAQGAWESFKNTMSTGWDAVKNVSVVGWIAQAFGGIGGMIGDLFKGIDIGDALGGVLDWFRDLPGNITEYLGNAMRSVQRFGAELPSRLGRFIGQAAGTVVRLFADLPSKIGDALSAAAGAVGRFFEDLPSRLGRALGLALGHVFGFGRNLFRWGAELVSNLTHTVVDWFRNLPSQAGGFLGQTAAAIRTWISDTVRSFAQWGMDVITSVQTWFAQLPGNLANWLTQAAQAIYNWIIQTAQAVWQWGLGVFNSIQDWIGRLPGMIGNFFAQIPSTIRRWATQAWGAARDLARQVWDAIVGFITGLPGRIAEIFGNIAGAIRSKIAGAVKAVKEFGSSMWNGFKDAIGMHSPSYFEKAMDSINDNMSTKLQTFAGQVAELQAMAGDMPRDFSTTMSVTATGTNLLQSSAASIPAGTTAPAPSSAGGPALVVQGPLIENASIRDEQDIVEISRDLAERLTDEQRSQGRKVLN